MDSKIEKSFRTLKKQNPSYFYTMNIHHNYHFKELTEGSLQTPGDTVQFFRNLYADWGRNPSFGLSGKKCRSACSAFTCRSKETGHLLLGRNLDWQRHPVLLYRSDPEDGYSSLAVSDFDAMNIFNFQTVKDIVLMAPYFPFEGINSRGLAVVMLTVPEAEAPFDQDKPTIGNFNLIRGILDYCANINEALSYIRDHNIIHGSIPIHYLLADANGRSCAVEHIAGRLEIVEKDIGPLALTNFPLSTTPLPEKACSRYHTLMQTLTENRESLNTDQTWALLKKTAIKKAGDQSAETVWSSVYDTQTHQLQMTLSQNFSRIFRLQID